MERDWTSLDRAKSSANEHPSAAYYGADTTDAAAAVTTLPCLLADLVAVL